MTTATAMMLQSPSFDNDGEIDRRHTCDGNNLSPELQWSHAPDDVRSFAIVAIDPDAPSGDFTHWVLFDVPSPVHALAEGTTGIGISGRNDFQEIGYRGPCPPKNHGSHRYYFRLFALDIDSVGLAQGATHQELERAMESHVLMQAEWMGRYVRSR
jgi:Raf kinase inhibitor-like YbhB/YbcL family protein